ncbi:phage portal protein [Quadrisphaera sp. GCM10027208]|uniref:phage portal protein n=1 Tax=Quadrisphaera sp. GCM10027208 TaxID=3273423 RepID=UPI003611EE63
MNDLLTTLLQRLDEPAARYAELDRYYSGTQPLSFLAPEAKTALGSRFGRMASNLPRLAVTALAERLRVVGFTRDGRPDEDLWADWVANDLDQTSGVAHREALTLGRAYVIVWGDEAGGPRVSVESARQVATLVDPGSRRVLAAVKRWETATTTEAVLFEADQVTRLRAQSTGATTAGFRTVEVLENPLGRPPVVALTNSDRLLDEHGTSEITDLAPLVDGLNKTLADMLVGSEYYARPRRWATGVELEEDDTGEATNPFPEDHRMMVAEESDAKFGSLPAADLGAYEAAVKVLLGQVMAVSALPGHYLGVMTAEPPSADSLRAAEASLTARAEARQATFGRSWEDVGRLMVAVRSGVDPDSVTVRVKWADPATRSVAQEADAVVKLHAAGLLPASVALARLGYTDDEIAAIRDARRAEALDGAGLNLTELLP